MKYLIFFMVLFLEKVSGEECTFLKTNETGVCKRLSACQPALKVLRTGKIPQTCRFEERHPIVCCEIEKIKEVKVRVSESAKQRLAKQKCDEYTQISSKIPKEGIDPTAIIGGKEASVDDFPYIAALGFGTDSELQWNCGGSLISEKFILTAAHCLEHSELGKVKVVRMGDVFLNRPSLSRQDFGVKRTIRHPDYHPPSRYNDIALIELNQTVKFKTEIQPACLNTKSDITNDTYIWSLEAAGWGLTEFAGSKSDILLKVYVDYFGNEECRKAYGKRKRGFSEGIKEDIQICAGGRKEEKDTCQGDSGGLLHIVDYSQTAVFMPVIVGVTSFGKSCGVVNVPGVYTKVAGYLDWIENIVWS